MDVSQLGNGVTGRPVDMAGQVAGLDVRNRNIHIGRRDRRGQDFGTIPCHQQKIRLQHIEHLRETLHLDAQRFRPGRRCIPAHIHVHAGGRCKPVPYDFIDRRSILLQEMHAGHDELQFQPLGLFDQVHHPLDIPIGGPGFGNDGNPALLHAFSCSQRIWLSFGISVLATFPITFFKSFAATAPGPGLGRFTQTIVGV